MGVFVEVGIFGGEEVVEVWFKIDFGVVVGFFG